MSSNTVISVENLSKAYRIGLKEEIPDTIVGAMTGWLRAPLRNWKRLRSLDTARLRDQVSGDNGNGKPSSPTPDTRHPTPRSPLTPDHCHLTPGSADTRHPTPRPGVRDQDSGDSEVAHDDLTSAPSSLTPDP